MEKNKNKRDEKHGSTLFLRILISVFSAVTLITLCMSLVYTTTFRDAAVQEYRELVQTSVSHIDAAFSRYADNANDYCEIFYSSVESVQLRIREDFKVTNATSLLYDIEKSFSIMPFSHSICIVNRENKVKGYVTNNSNGRYTTDLKTILPPALNQSPNQQYPILWIAKSNYVGRSDIPLLTFYKREVLPDNPKYNGSVTVNVDTQALSRSLFADMTRQGISYFILNHEGRVVAASDTHRCGQNLSAETYVRNVLVGYTDLQNITVDGKTYEIYSIPASVDNFYIVAQYEYLNELNRFHGAALTIVVATVLMDLLAGAVLYLVCRNIFKPFNKIVSDMKQSELLDDAQPDNEDLAILRQYHNQTASYMEHMKEEAHKNQIVKAILQQKNVDFLLLQYAYICSGEPYYMLLLQIGKEHNDVVQLTEYNRIRTDLEMVCLEHLGTCTYFEVGFRRIMVLVNRPEGILPSFRELQRTIADIQNQITETYNIQSTAYLSEKLLADAPERTCNEAYQLGEGCLKTYRFLNPDTPAAMIGEPTPTNAWKKPLEDALQQTRRQDRERFIYHLGQMLGILQHQPWHTFRQAVLQLAMEISKIRDDTEISVEYSHALAEKVSSITDRERLCTWLTELFDDTSSWMQTVQDNASMPVIEKMVSYIESNYTNRELNLNMLANQMHISAPYLGKLFHNFTGSSFNSYLTRMRMARARELLLLDRDANIATIAAQVGYSNSSYFTATFKNYYGINPSVYRNQKEVESEAPPEA